MPKTCLFENGELKFVELAEAKLAAFDASYLFGDGVYEVIAVVNGRLFDLEPHLARLEKSLAIVMIPKPSMQIADVLEKLLQQNNIAESDNGYVYLQISRGTAAKRDFIISEKSSNFFAYYQVQELFTRQNPDQGETSLIFPDIRWSLKHVKTTQLMASRLAKKVASENACLEPIYVAEDGTVTEGGSTNIFIVKNSEIITHPADNAILWGITRMRVIELAGKFGMVVREEKFSLEDLLGSDEVFRTSTSIGARGITKIKIIENDPTIFAGVDNVWSPENIGEYKIGNGKVGEITQKLAAEYAAFATNPHPTLPRKQGRTKPDITLPHKQGRAKPNITLPHKQGTAKPNITLPLSRGRTKVGVLPKPRAIIFDWDNTLVDSWPIIHAALHETFTQMGTTPWTLEETKARTAKSMRDHFPELFGKRWQEAGDIYTKSYRKRHMSDLQMLPEAEAMLDELQDKGIYLAIVSNKQGPVLRLEAEHLGLTKHFQKLIGATDAVRDKPYPEPLLLALKGSDITPGADVWFVGDSEVDMECALNSGCTPVFYGDGKLPDDMKDKVFYATDHGIFRKFLSEHFTK